MIHIVFEIELVKQVEINIDYNLELVKKYHDKHCMDKANLTRSMSKKVVLRIIQPARASLAD